MHSSPADAQEAELQGASLGGWVRSGLAAVWLSPFSALMSLPKMGEVWTKYFLIKFYFGIILELKRSYKDSTTAKYPPLIFSQRYNFYISVVHLSQRRNQCWHMVSN